ERPAQVQSPVLAAGESRLQDAPFEDVAGPQSKNMGQGAPDRQLLHTDDFLVRFPLPASGQRRGQVQVDRLGVAYDRLYFQAYLESGTCGGQNHLGGTAAADALTVRQQANLAAERLIADAEEILGRGRKRS